MVGRRLFPFKMAPFGFPQNFSARIPGIGLFLPNTNTCRRLFQGYHGLQLQVLSTPISSRFFLEQLLRRFQNFRLEKKAEVQGGSLPATNGVITPISKVITPVSQLFSSNYFRLGLDPYQTPPTWRIGLPVTWCSG